MLSSSSGHRHDPSVLQRHSSGCHLKVCYLLLLGNTCLLCTWLAVPCSSKPLFQEDFPKQSREVKLLPYSLLQNSISWSCFFPSQYSTHSVTTSFVHILLTAFSTKMNASSYQRCLAYWPLCLQLLEQFLGSNPCSISTC